MRSVLHGRKGKPSGLAGRRNGSELWLLLDQPEPVFELGDAQFQLVELRARGEAEPDEEVVETLPRTLAEPRGIAPPPGQRVVEEPAGVVPAHPAPLAQLAGELVEAICG